MRWFPFLAALLWLSACEEPPEYATREITIWNRYTSNGHDNYDNIVEVNFRLEGFGWLWLYTSGNRAVIASDQSRSWQFRMSPDYDSIYVHVRFYYDSQAAQPLQVAADTTLDMDEDKTLVFWNCGDSTVTEYPFPACLTDSLSFSSMKNTVGVSSR